jgi:hypothetical protein
MDYNVRIGGIISLQMHCIVVLAIHAWMHHEDTRFNIRALTGLEYHRTDG